MLKIFLNRHQLFKSIPIMKEWETIAKERHGGPQRTRGRRIAVLYRLYVKWPRFFIVPELDICKKCCEEW